MLVLLKLALRAKAIPSSINKLQWSRFSCIDPLGQTKQYALTDDANSFKLNAFKYGEEWFAVGCTY